MAEPKKKILIIEDDQFTLKLYAARLVDEGFDVVATPSAKEAARLAEDHRPHLVIVDLMLQDGDGFSVISELRSLPACKDTPIVALSNLEQETDIAEAQRRGANEYLVKSALRFHDVIEKIKSLVR